MRARASTQPRHRACDHSSPDSPEAPGASRRLVVGGSALKAAPAPHPRAPRTPSAEQGHGAAKAALAARPPPRAGGRLPGGGGVGQPESKAPCPSPRPGPYDRSGAQASGSRLAGGHYRPRAGPLRPERGPASRHLHASAAALGGPCDRSVPWARRLTGVAHHPPREGPGPPSSPSPATSRRSVRGWDWREKKSSF